MNTTGICASKLISHMFQIPRCLEPIRDTDRLDVIGTTCTIANLENLVDVAFVGALATHAGNAPTAASHLECCIFLSWM
jgi:hypothetical protein